MNEYEDIIHLPHHQSTRHAPMSREMRAAQFAPFAALTGYGDAVKETARLTDERIELGEGQLELLNRKLMCLIECEKMQPQVTVTYFKPDSQKAGGAYIARQGKVLRVDAADGFLVFTDKSKISVSDILFIEGDVFLPKHEKKSEI